jgi:phosphatidate cytidylyltransferase
MIATNLRKRIYTSFLLLLLLFIIYSYNLILVYSLIIFGVLSILEFLNISGKIIHNKFYLISLNSFFVFYIFIFCFFFLYYSNFFQLKIVLFTFLLGCIASDIGGFIFGKIFKGPKLTKISPNKTIAGAFGSIILSIAVMSYPIFYFTKSFSFLFLLVATITSIGCQLGDLLFSALKRKAKMKDTGNIFPGHGGVLDRLDGLLLGIPVGVIFLILIY